MTYLLLNSVFVSCALAVAALAWWRRPSYRPLLAASGLALAAVLLLTAVFDNIMIGVGLIAYDPAAISGLFVGAAPVEDFAYPVAAALLLPAVWSLLGGDDRMQHRGHRTPAVGRPDEEGQHQ